GGHTTRDRFGGEDRAQRETAADALDDRHQVGCDLGELVGEESAGPPNATLDLVQRQQCTRGVADRADLGEIARGPHLEPALAEDRFEQHRGRPLSDDLAQGIEVAPSYLPEARQQWPEALDHLFAARGRNGTGRTTVEGSLEGDDLDP